MLRKEFIEQLFEYFSASQTTLFDLTKRARTHDLTVIQYNILEYLYFNDGKGISKLADCVYLSLPNASREVRKLNEMSLIKKQQDPKDRRKTYIFLSEEGKLIMDKAFGIMTSHLEDKLKDLSCNEQKQLEENMRNIMCKLFS